MIVRFLFLVGTLFSFSTVNAQFPKDSKSGEVIYTDIIEMDGMSKESIYEKARFWIISTLKSGDNMVELDGSNSDKIVGTGNMALKKLDWGFEGNPQISPIANLNFKFIVRVKDNKVKYSVENFELAYGGGTYIHRTNLTDFDIYKHPSYSAKKFEKYKEYFQKVNEPYVDKVIRELIEDFTNSMKSIEDEDW